MTNLRSFLARASVLSMVVLKTCHGFYVPGVRPHEFSPGEDVPMKVNSLTSIHTQLPKDYYRLPFCRPTGGPKMASENLGEFLTGNKIQNSPYSINMLREVYCQVLCQVTLTKVEAHTLGTHIKYGYHNNWIIDNLPGASVGLTGTGQHQTHYAGGFPIGFIAQDTKETFVYNHFNILLEYHNPEGKEGHRVVGFAVEPMSISHKYSGGYVWAHVEQVHLEGFDCLSEIGLKPFSTTPTSIKRLVLKHCQDMSEECLPSIGRMEHLTSLHIVNSAYDEVPMFDTQSLHHLNTLVALKSLSLFYVLEDPSNLKALWGLRDSLETLNIALEDELDEEDVDHLCQHILPMFGSLQKLRIFSEESMGYSCRCGKLEIEYAAFSFGDLVYLD